jgi:peptidoglycan/xylan/chitin deacetylase (PgdA/CDA1 family)
MRRITVLAAVSAVVVAVAAGSFVVGRGFRAHEQVAKAPAAKTTEPDLVTGTIAARAPASPGKPQAPSQPIAAASPVSPPPPNPPVATGAGRTNAATTAAAPSCPGNPDALSVSRVVEIDTAGGPGFGSEQFKSYDFLEPGEIVLTFDDGPWPGNTPAVLAALAAQCVKATFFPIGKHATWHPEILKQVLAQGHTVGSHTWSHADLARKSTADAKEEIERGISAVTVSAGRPIVPFFRFPALRHTPELLSYLAERNIGAFSADLDSFDFKLKKPELVIASVMTKLKKLGKGIILMHDFQHSTAMALPELLAQLKANGYRVVHLKAKDTVATLPQYDAMMAKVQGGQTVDARPTASVVRTISTYAAERPKPD